MPESAEQPRLDSTQGITPNSTKSSPLKNRLAEMLSKMNFLPEVIQWQQMRKKGAHLDDISRREMEAYHKLIHGERAIPPTEEDDMGHIVFGDMITNPEPKPPQKNGKGTLAKVATLAALALGSGGIGAGTMVAINALDLLKEKAPEIQDRLIERNTNENLKILPPIVREPE